MAGDGPGVTVVMGAQWGDEGKGKLVDVLAADADIVARCAVRTTPSHCRARGVARHAPFALLGPFPRVRRPPSAFPRTPSRVLTHR